MYAKVSTEDTDVPQDSINVNLKLLSGVSVILSGVPTTAAVERLKVLVRDTAEIKEAAIGRNLRLIFQGKLLEDGRSLASYGLFDHCSVHCVISTAPASLLPTPTPAAVHGSVAVSIPDATGLPGGRRGFDSLLDFGFVQADVDAFRIRFASEVDLMEATLPLLEGETAASRRLRAEDEFRHSQPGEPEDWGHGSPENGGPLSFACGFFVGMTLGYIVMILLADRTASRRFKLGLASGVLVQVVFALVQQSKR